MRVTFVGAGDAFGSGGRLNTCLLVEAGPVEDPAASLLLDCGATSVVSLARRTPAERNRVSAVLLTHFHGDHLGGLPFLLLDAQFVSNRAEPLLVAGPRGVEARVRAVCETLFPGLSDVERRFPLSFLEVSPGAAADVAGFAVEAFPTVHDERVGPCQGYRLSRNGKTLAVSGDTGWTDALVPLGEGADLLVIECYFRDRSVAGHLDAATLHRRRADLRARRLLATHLGPELFDAAGEPQLAALGLEAAFDGMTVEL